MINNKIVDILIPAYNAHKSIVRTLASIAIQECNFEFRVYVINDGSIKDYSEEIKMFEDSLNITELKLAINSGVGVARGFGVEHSFGDYILFIDSDDVFYNACSLRNLYNLVSDRDYDFVYGAIIDESRKKDKVIKFHDSCLHGKMYKREFLVRNNIKFNTTRTSEDNSFNHICLLKAKEVNCTEDIVYVYKYSTISLTKGLDTRRLYCNLRDFVENIIYVMDNAIDINDRQVILYYLNGYSFIYNHYKHLKKTNIENDVLILLKKLENAGNVFNKEKINKIVPEIDFIQFKNNIGGNNI